MAISFSVRVAAEQSGLSERTIRGAVARGDIKALRIGRRVLITPKALTEYLNGKTVETREGER